MRSLRREFLSVASVLALPTAVFLVFPFEALTFKAMPSPSECPSSAAFVTLTSEQESAALVAARTSWQTDAADRQRRNVLLPLGELPEMSGGPLVKSAAILRPVDSPAALGFRPEAWKPSLRSAAPTRLEKDPASPPPLPFSREDLLKLN